MNYVNGYSDSQIQFNHTIDEKPKPDDFKMHTHSTCEIYCFLNGNGIFHVEGSNYPLKSGDILIMRPFESHYIEIKPDKPYERLSANVPVTYFDFCDSDKKLFDPFFKHKPGEYNLYRADNFSSDLYAYVLERLTQNNNLSQPLVTGCILSLLNELYFADNRKELISDNKSDVHAIIQYINQNIDRHISLSDLCDKFFMSKSVLCKKFKLATGSTISNYITTKKLIKIDDLIQSGKNITEAANIYGYNEYSTFYRAYKKVFNKSPYSAKSI